MRSRVNHAVSSATSGVPAPSTPITSVVTPWNSHGAFRRSVASAERT